MPEAIQGPEVFGEGCPLIDAVHLLRDIYPLSALAIRKDRWAFGLWVREQRPSGLLNQREFLVLPALGVADMDNSPLEVHILPLVSRQSFLFGP